MSIESIALSPVSPITFGRDASPFSLAEKLPTPLGLRDASTTGTATDVQRSFAEVLSIADRMPIDQAARTDESRAAAESMVATTLVQPILKQVRESTQAPPPFGPSKAELQFQGLIDAHTAKEIVRSSQFGLVDRLAQDLRSRSASAVTEPAQEASS